MRIIIYLLSGIAFVISISCEKVADYYIGFPLQPDILTDDFAEGLNIFGIIRPDTLNGLNQSFVHVQKVIRAVGDTTSDLEIKNAAVWIYSYSDNENTDTFKFSYIVDTTKKYRQYKPDISFNTDPNRVYELKCSAEGLPDLWGKTTVPFKPLLVENSLNIGNNSINFKIEADTSAFMYLVYLFVNEMPVINRIVIPVKGNNTSIELPAGSDQGNRLVIYAYDEKLANYIANSNTALNINKYREYDNQVTGGYGVFGSLNFTEIILE